MLPGRDLAASARAIRAALASVGITDYAPLADLLETLKAHSVDVGPVGEFLLRGWTVTLFADRDVPLMGIAFPEPRVIAIRASLADIPGAYREALAHESAHAITRAGEFIPATGDGHCQVWSDTARTNGATYGCERIAPEWFTSMVDWLEGLPIAFASGCLPPMSVWSTPNQPAPGWGACGEGEPGKAQPGEGEGEGAPAPAPGEGEPEPVALPGDAEGEGEGEPQPAPGEGEPQPEPAPEGEPQPAPGEGEGEGAPEGEGVSSGEAQPEPEEPEEPAREPGTDTASRSGSGGRGAGPRRGTASPLGASSIRSRYRD